MNLSGYTKFKKKLKSSKEQSSILENATLIYKLEQFILIIWTFPQNYFMILYFPFTVGHKSIYHSPYIAHYFSFMFTPLFKRT